MPAKKTYSLKSTKTSKKAIQTRSHGAIRIGGLELWDERWSALFKTNDSNHGIDVTENTALGFTPWYAAITKIAQSIASLSCKMYEQNAETKIRVYEHPAYKLLHNEANEYMSAFVFKETFVGHAVTWGNAFAWIRREEGTRVPYELLLIHPARIQLKNNSPGIYLYTALDGKQIEILAADILHLPGFSPDGYWGFRPTQLFNQALGLGLALEKFGAGFFGNSAVPSGILSYPNTIEDKEARQTIISDWHEMAKLHQTALLEGGLEYTPTGTDQQKSQYIESRKYSIDESARITGVPQHMLGNTENASYASLEINNQEFYTQCLMPWCQKFEQELTRKLLKGTNYFLEFDVDTLLRADSKTRSEIGQTNFMNGRWSINQWKAYENEEPIDGGDVHYIPANLIALDKPEEAIAGDVPVPTDQKIQTSEATVLNGAQIVAAQTIVLSVAKGELPRDSGVAMLQTFFNLTPAKAEEIMGSTGKDFQPTLPEQKPNPFDNQPTEPQRDLSPAVFDALSRMLSVERNALNNYVGKESYQSKCQQFYSKHSDRLMSALLPVATILSPGNIKAPKILEPICRQLSAACLLSAEKESEALSMIDKREQQLAEESNSLLSQITKALGGNNA